MGRAQQKGLGNSADAGPRAVSEGGRHGGAVAASRSPRRWGRCAECGTWSCNSERGEREEQRGALLVGGGSTREQAAPAGPEPSGQQEPGAGSSSAGRGRGQVCRRGAVMVPASLESPASALGEQRARAAAGGAPAAPFLYGFTSEGNAALKEPDGFRCVCMSVLN